MQTSSERWSKVKTLFEDAISHRYEEREALLARECTDEEVLSHVRKLLSYHDAAGNFMQDPALRTGMPSPSEIIAQACNDTAPQLDSVPAAPSTQRDDLREHHVGAYLLVRRIGSGGMADVYLAERADDEYRKKVAVKIIRPGLDSEEVLARFRNERQTLAGLDHPNIVKLLDGGSEAGVPYLVMDYVEGDSIDRYCDLHLQSIDERLRLFCVVCAAVQHAHEHQVIHRDLKPSNILVTADGIPKLLDFGISKVLIPSTALPSEFVTQTATRRLTLGYASPEQVRGEKLTPATDIYSLGVVLYELLSGHRPYRVQLQTPAEIERAICDQEPETPGTAIQRTQIEFASDGKSHTKSPELVSRSRASEPQKLRRRLRGDLDNIVLMALAKEPQRRYSSASELADDIQRHLSHLPVKARRPTTSYRLSKFVRRHKAEFIAACLVLLTLIAAIAYSARQSRRADERSQADLILQRNKGRRSVAVVGFKNLSRRPDGAWMATALAEMFTSELSAGGKLRLISQEEVARTKLSTSVSENSDLDAETLDRLLRNLHSDYVVVGSYFQIGDGTSGQIRVDVRLYDAALQENVESASATDKETGVSDIVAHISGTLRRRLQIGDIASTDSQAASMSIWSNPQVAQLYSSGIAKQRSYDSLETTPPFSQNISLGAQVDYGS